MINYLALRWHSRETAEKVELPTDLSTDIVDSSNCKTNQLGVQSQAQLAQKWVIEKLYKHIN